jgi:hypothetical protein
MFRIVSLIQSLRGLTCRLSRRAPVRRHVASLLAAGVFAASLLAVPRPALAQSDSTFTTSILNVTRVHPWDPDPYDMTCTVNTSAIPGVAGPTGTVTFTDATTGATLSTVQLGAATQQPGFVPKGFVDSNPIIATADFNHDGIPDLLDGARSGSCGTTACAAVLLGKGDGTFQAPKLAPALPGADTVPGHYITGDFNGDGKLDLAWYVASYPQVLQVLPGNGDGTFQASAVAYSLPQNYNLTVVLKQAFDLNGDGYSDLLESSVENSTFWVVLHNNRNNQQPGFQATLTLPSTGPFRDYHGWALVAGGKIDLVGAITDNNHCAQSLDVYMGNGDGTFQPPVSYAPVGSGCGGGLKFTVGPAGYFNNNGALDVAYSYAGVIQFLLGNGDGTFQSGYNFSLWEPGRSPLFAGSFLRSGEEDLAAADTNYTSNFQSMFVWAGNGDGTFATPPVKYGLAVPLSDDGTISAAKFDTNGLLGFAGNYTVSPYPNGAAYVLLDGTMASAVGTDPSVTVQAGTTAVHKIQCSYAGDANYAPSSSNFVSEAYSAASAPVFSLKVGTYYTAQSVSISDASPGTTIYYTTDGSTPTTDSTPYTNPIPVTSTVTLKAIAAGGAYLASPVSEVIYQVPAPPTFSLPAGTYSGTQNVSIHDATAGATIFYTTDGTTPSTSSTVYAGPIAVSGKMTLMAMARSGQLLSPVASISYNTPLASSTASLKASAMSVNVGQQVTLTATITGSSPTGSVTFSAGSSPLGVVNLVNGIATLQTSFSAVGTYSITAAYSGDAENAASTSSAVSLTVALPSTTTALQASAGTVNLNQPVTLTGTVTGSSPTGSVTFSANGSQLGTANLIGGTATYQATFATAATYQITARYSGDAQNAASTSSAVSITVVAPSFTPGTPPSPQTVSAGGTATYQVTFAAVGGYSGTISLTCTGLPSKATCSFNPASLKFTGSGSQSSTLSIATTASTSAFAAPLPSPAQPPGKPLSKPLFLAGLVGLLFGCTRMRRLSAVLRSAAGLLLLVAVALLPIACGGGGSHSGGGGIPGTPAGTYNVTVNAVDSANNLNQTLTVTLTVQ